MRKLKLQMQQSLDGFVAGPQGQMDWMTRSPDAALLAKLNELTDSSDLLLLGRKMSPGFVSYWEQVADTQPESPEFTFAQKMVQLPKIVFSKTTDHMAGKNLRVENGDLATVVQQLKEQPGKDILVYGGAGFVTSLIAADLIDEYNLIISPVAIGAGMRIFTGRKDLRLVASVAYGNGKVVNTYMRG